MISHSLQFLLLRLALISALPIIPTEQATSENKDTKTVIPMLTNSTRRSENWRSCWGKMHGATTKDIVDLVLEAAVNSPRLDSSWAWN
ncbi:hypothetical protein C8J56DRAFT_965616, partial [Mycena floridula]